MRIALDGDSCSNLTASYLGNKTFFEAEKKDDNIELCSTTKIAYVKWEETNIALGQYWFLLLLHGFIPPGPGQYGVLLPWLEEDMN